MTIEALSFPSRCPFFVLQRQGILETRETPQAEGHNRQTVLALLVTSWNNMRFWGSGPGGRGVTFTTDGLC